MLISSQAEAVVYRVRQERSGPDTLASWFQIPSLRSAMLGAGHSRYYIERRGPMHLTTRKGS
jgi:hypothetical protein